MEQRELTTGERSAGDGGAGASVPASRPQAPPAEVSAPLGRSASAAEVVRGFDRGRLVTIVGTGGVGKTRLAVHVAPAVRASTSCWIEVAPLLDGGRLLHTVAAGAGVRLRDGDDPLTTLTSSLADRAVLLVLDSCERHVREVAELVEHLLQRCPAVRVMATSRVALDLPDEQVVQLDPLPRPTSTRPTLADLRRAPATALFLERARGLDVDALGPEDRAAIAQLCHHLDGVPLAIELAAARLPTLTPRELVARLPDRFALLTDGGRSSRPDRQRTLEASIRWSYELLEDRAQQVLRRLAVFRGAFDLPALRAVAQVEDELAALDLVTELVNSNLVRVAPDGHTGRRYRLYESVAAYLLGMLETSDEVDQVRDAHLATVLRRLDELADGAPTGLVLGATPWVVTELHDVQAASAWAAATDRPELVVQLWWPLHLALAVHEKFGAAHAAVAALEPTDPLPEELDRRRAIMLATGTGRYEAAAFVGEAERVVARLREQDADPVELFCALGTLATHSAWAGRPAPEAAREMVELERANRDRWGVLATVATGTWATRSLDVTGHPSEAYPVARDAATAAATIGSPTLEAVCEARSAAAALRLGLHVDTVAEHVDRSLSLLPDGWEQTRLWFTATIGGGLHLSLADGDGLIARLDEVAPHTVDGPDLLALDYGRLLAALAGGASEAAVVHADALLAALGPDQEGWLAAAVRADLAEALRLVGRTEEARAALGEARARLQAATDPLTRMVLSSTAGALLAEADPTTALRQLVADAAELLAQEHRCWLYLQLLPAARALVGMGRHADAATVLGTIDGEHEARGQQVWGIHRDEFDAVVAVCADTLGPDAVAAARTRGAELTWEACVAWLREERVRSRDGAVTGWASLTPAEEDVARLAARGASTAEVADALFVSTNTVKTHLRRIYRKLDVTNRVELARVVEQADEPG